MIGICFSLIPDNSFDSVIQQGSEHTVKQAQRFILKKSCLWKRIGLGTNVIFPWARQVGLPVSAKKAVRFFRNKSAFSSITDDADGDRVFSFSQQAARNLIFSGWILICCAAYRCAVDIDAVPVDNAAHPYFSRSTSHEIGDCYFSAEPDRSVCKRNSFVRPIRRKLNFWPLGIVIFLGVPWRFSVQTRIPRIQRGIPGIFSLTFRL